MKLHTPCRILRAITQYGSVRSVTPRRSPQPPLKRGARGDQALTEPYWATRTLDAGETTQTKQ